MKKSSDKRTLEWRHHSSYTIWYGMIERCYNPMHDAYWDYGGRGICVAESWLYSPHSEEPRTRAEAFRNFVSDMGYRPNQFLSLDRIKVNEHYTADNCQWTTQANQNRNKRNSLYVPDPSDPSKQIPVAELAERLKIPYRKLRYRLQRAGVWPGDVND